VDAHEPNMDVDWVGGNEWIAAGIFADAMLHKISKGARPIRLQSRGARLGEHIVWSETN